MSTHYPSRVEKMMLGICATVAAAAAALLTAAAPAGAIGQGPPVASAAAPAKAQAAAPGRQALPPSYRVNAGDVLEISVQDYPELSKVVTILPDGTIQFPYMGEVFIQGSTIRQIKERVLAALKKQVSYPEVTVTVVKRNIREVGVIGNGIRGQGGRRPHGDNWRVINLIADGGGLMVDRPEWVKSSVLRGGGAEVIPIDLVRAFAGDLDANIPLEPEDVLVVEQLDDSKTKVQVLGEVMRPGPVPAPVGGSVIDALTAAGGPSPKASLALAAIRKPDNSLVPVNLVNYDSAAGKAPEVKMEPGDTLLIPENKRVYSMTGAVLRPSQINYPEDREVTILEALAEAGGPGGGADLKNTVLMRRGEDGKVVSQMINLDDIVKNKQKADKSGKKTGYTDPVLKPGDVIFIPTKEQGKENLLDKAIRYLPLMFLL